MKLLKFILALVISCSLILASYYLVWNFMANKRLVTIVNGFETSENFAFEYKSSIASGYPNDIKITFEDLLVKSKNSDKELNYKLGDVFFKIYPFVLEQQAEIILPKSHAFSIKYGDESKQFKLQTSGIDLRFVDNSVNFDFSDVKIFDLEANKLILQSDKVYYTGYIDSSSHFKFNAKNLKIGNKTVDSVLIDADLSKMNQLDIYSIILNLLTLDNGEYNSYLKSQLEILNKNESSIKFNSLKYVDGKNWFEFTGNLKLETRNRLRGSIEIVSNNLPMTEAILHFITANPKIDITTLDLIKRLTAKDQNNLIRISGKLERGFLQLFNEKVARVKSFAK